MARLAGRARGEMRAMEEESERFNPVRGYGMTPSMSLSLMRGSGREEEDSESESDEEMEGGGHVIGGGFRDGLRNFSSRRANARNAAAAAAQEVVAGGRRRAAVRGKNGKARNMGFNLSNHISSVYGAGFWDDFKHGFNSVVAPVAGIAKGLLPMLGPEGMAASSVIGALGYGHTHDLHDLHGAGFLDFLKPIAGVAKNFLPILGPQGMAVSGLMSAVGLGHGGATNSNTGAYHGHGRLGEDGHGIFHGGALTRKLFSNIANKHENMMGASPKDAKTHAKIVKSFVKAIGDSLDSGDQAIFKKWLSLRSPQEKKWTTLDDASLWLMTNVLAPPEYPEPSTGPWGVKSIPSRSKKSSSASSVGRKAPKANDGRRVRAEIVKRVMREQGLKMIEASKYVKAHNLY
jgi:hypothetical protein